MTTYFAAEGSAGSASKSLHCYQIFCLIFFL